MTFESILPIPDLFAARRVLCIQPHYDDNDIGAGGTIALLAQGGAEIFYLTVTDDLAGVVDRSLSDVAARACLARDQQAAGKIVGVKQHITLDYPDAGEYSYFAVRADILKYIRLIQPDLVLTCDPWLTYEAHHDHIQTGHAVAEAVQFAGLLKIPSSDPAVDAAYQGHTIEGAGFYYCREPNQIVDITPTWETKVAAIRAYATQIPPDDADQIVTALQFKSAQICAGRDFQLGEPFKILHPQGLHCGL